MNKRPVTVSITGCLFVVVGSGCLVAALAKLSDQSAGRMGSGCEIPHDSILVAMIAVLAIVGGVFLFRAKNWARWLCTIWMGAHVVISLWHSLQQVIVHGVFLAIIVYLLFRAPASAYFRRPPAS